MPRKRIEINQGEFEKLCGLQCSLEEIATWFNCSSDTIERWCLRTFHRGFAEVFAEKRGYGKIALRRAQFELAKKNAAMAIFLGKNYLGQQEHIIYEDTASLAKLDEIIGGLKETAAADLGTIANVTQPEAE